MVKKFASASEAKKARGAKLKEAMEGCSITVNKLAGLISSTLGMAESSTRGALYNITGGHRDLTPDFAKAAAPHLGVTAESLLIKPVWGEAWEQPPDGEEAEAEVPANPTTTRKSRATTQFLKLFKDQELTANEVIAKIGDQSLAEEIIDASMNVGEISKETWKKIRKAYGVTRNPKQTPIKRPEKPTRSKSGSIHIGLELNKEEFYKLFDGSTIRAMRQGETIVITAEAVLTADEFFDLF